VLFKEEAWDALGRLDRMFKGEEKTSLLPGFSLPGALAPFNFEELISQNKAAGDPTLVS
jgi:hypothetical protein